MKIVSNGKVIEIGGGSGSGGDNWEIYSTEERRIGIWIDGRPLYRKVINLTLPSTIGTTIYSGVDLPENSVLARYEGFCTTTANTQLALYAMGYTYVSFVGRQIWFGTFTNDFASAALSLIVEYTKTTDEPIVSAKEDGTF